MLAAWLGSDSDHFFGQGFAAATDTFALARDFPNYMIDSAGLYPKSLGALAGIPAAPA